MARKRARRSGRRLRGPGTAEITTVILLVCMLVFILLFKDSIASNFSGLLGTIGGSSAPELTESGPNSGDNQSATKPPQREDP